MNEDLMAIVAADEEARAHVQGARNDAEARVNGARDSLARARDDALAALRAQVARQVQAVDGQTMRTLEQRVAARAASVAARRQVADAALDEAVDLFARLVIEGVAPRERA
jgi:hypothetical protein